jgi:hypothetical protein
MSIDMNRPAVGNRPPVRRRWSRRLLLSLTAAAVVYGVLLVRPQIVFAYEVRAENVVLHARSPLPDRAAEIAAAAQRRVSRSPLYVPTDTYDVYLCDTPALFAFFAPLHANVGGIADVYLTRNVWLRPSHLERDRLVGPSGAEASGDRTLTYFIAHEITHIMTARHVGRRGYYQLEKWQQEGYADYVGKGGAFDFPAVQRDFQAGVPALDPRRSGLYLRYHLLVAELIDHKGMTVEALLSHPIDAAPIEKALAGR